LRRSAIAVALALAASLGIGTLPAAAATSPSGEPRVVIIVGATHGATASYRADADRAYAEAIKYTSDVTKVYSPNATWGKVKSAAIGASVVIYMGHGNGWPSPYTYDPNYTTKDGFGLNATAGAGDYNNKYYGEPYVSTLDLAPGAVVLLHHLCYASGNSEPGDPEPTAAVARKRADNYAAGFLKAGASAVIADGHAGAEGYLRALFTTHQSLESMWRTMPNQNGHVTSFASSRTPGATIFQDPNKATSGFYRSLAVGVGGVTTDEVIAGGLGDTGSDPVDLEIPGNASVLNDEASLYLDAGGGDVARTLPAGTRLRIADVPAQVSEVGAPVVAVQGLDDPSITGFMAIADLTPRDSTPPVVRMFDPGGPFSPDGDGQIDEATIKARFSEAVAWSLKITGDTETLFQTTGTGASVEVVWDGLDAGVSVPDGEYQVRISGIDAWKNGTATAIQKVRVDTQAPTLADLTPDDSVTLWFSPNGDGVRDTVRFTADNPEPGAVVAKVRDSGGSVIDKWTVVNGADPVALTWDGRTSAGGYAPDGTYTVSAIPQDLAGNTGGSVTRTVQLIAALRSVDSSRSIFFPQDLDGLARRTKLRLTLQRPMAVSWTVLDGTGATVATRPGAADLPAGDHSWTFNGRGADGAMLPRGWYTAQAQASDGDLIATQSVAFELEAFRLTPSDTTPGRGQTITIVVNSPELLATAPRLVVDQPGLSRWRVTTSKTGKHKYKVTIRLKSAGKAGIVSFKVKGYDRDGGKQSTTVTYKLH